MALNPRLLLGALKVARGRSPGTILGIPYYFCLVNWASLVALVQVFAGRRYTTWTSSRPEAAADSRSRGR